MYQKLARILFVTCFFVPAVAGAVSESLAMFVEWAKARPQYMNELPVETEFRFLIEKWPCKK